MVQTVQKIVKFLHAFLDKVVLPLLQDRWLSRQCRKPWSLRRWCCSWTRLLTCPCWPRRSCSSSTGVSAHHGKDELMRRLLRSVYIGTRPWLTPAIRAGKGWWGRRELAPRRSATHLGACIVGACGETHTSYTRSEPQPPQPPPPQPQPPPQPPPPQPPQAFHSRRSVFLNFCANQAVAMSERGSAWRRRERQLRARHRHLRTTVAMELATALHHSAQPAGPVVEGPSEEEVHEKYEALRRQKRPPPGTRPGVPLDPEPLVAAATVGCVAAEAPLLVVASLSSGGVDATTVSYLLEPALKKEEEDEEEERKVQERLERRSGTGWLRRNANARRR